MAAIKSVDGNHEPPLLAAAQSVQAQAACLWRPLQTSALLGSLSRGHARGFGGASACITCVYVV